MNKKELKKKLEAEGIDKNAYSLWGGLPHEKYVLSHNLFLRRWTVYYSERGCRTGKKFFNSESEACKYFLKLLLNDSTTRK